MIQIHEKPCRVLAIGCSWGGLHALTRFLDHLPEDLDMAVAIAQHRANAPSNLAELLGQHTSWPVCEAEDKESISSRRVYLAPPGYHLLVDGGSFALSTDEPVRHSRPSIDVFFESVADALADRVVGVVLTGANDDGAAGAARIALRGGRVFVQDPATAEKRAMPEATIAAVPGASVASIEDLPALVAGAVAADVEAEAND